MGPREAREDVVVLEEERVGTDVGTAGGEYGVRGLEDGGVRGRASLSKGRDVFSYYQQRRSSVFVPP